MLIAIQQHLASRDPEVHCAVDRCFGSYRDRARYGLWVCPSLKRRGRGTLSLQLMPAPLKTNLGIVASAQIGAVVDASGFAYGDIHGPEPTEALAFAIAAFKRKRRRPFILLPQAFGSFTTPRIRDAILQVADLADRIYARDKESYEALVDVCGHRETIRIAPDFTALVEPSPVESPMHGQVLVIPNARMLDKTESQVAEGYIPLILELVGRVRGLGLEAEILLHDRDEDAAIAKAINSRLDEKLPVLSSEDPLRLKGLIGRSSLLIGSRFHALVGALSQAVPSIGIGWSHKYEALFSDYGCPECLLPIGADGTGVGLAIKRTIADRDALRAILSQTGVSQRGHIAEMWSDVDQCLGLGGKFRGL